MDPKINLNLRPYSIVFVILASQLAILQYFAGHLNGLTLANGSWIQLDGFHPVIFNILAQWLLDGNIWPMRDCSVSSSASSMLDLLDVNFANLMDTSNDNNPYAMMTARRLLHAYFMGLRIGAHHIMDAILNLIVRHLRLDAPPQPDHVFQVYMRSDQGLHGLKKLLVDAYIWTSRMSNGQVSRLSDYMPAFQEDVNATLRDIQTRKYTFDAANPNNPRNYEMIDMEVNFTALENCLCHGNQGRSSVATMSIQPLSPAGT